MPAEIQSLFSGLMLRCHRCEKITLVTLEKADEHTKRITMGKFYKPDEGNPGTFPLRCLALSASSIKSQVSEHCLALKSSSEDILPRRFLQIASLQLGLAL